MLTLLPMLAHAQTFTVQSDSVLTDPRGQGQGAPSVVWNEAAGLFEMYYEVQVTPTPRGCSEAWVVRRATSVDGISFTMAHGRDIGSSRDFLCGARAPSAVMLDDGSSAVFFQALDPTHDDGVGVHTTVNGHPERYLIEDLRGIYEPTAARLDGQWAVMGVDASASIVVARSADLVSFTFDPAPELPVGIAPWATDGVGMPALGCIDHTRFPWELYFGGWSGSDTGWARGISTAAGAWYLAYPFGFWSDDSAWRSLDFVTDGTSTMVYFETVDENGVPHVGASLSGAGLVTSALRDRDCES